MSRFFVGVVTVVDESLVVFLPLRREVKQQCSTCFRFAFRDQSFLEHGLDGAMHHRAIETKALGNLVLIEGSVVPQGRENEAASRRAARLSFQTFAHCEVGSGQMCEYRIFQNVIWNFRLENRCLHESHRIVTVASIGRRH